jgi:hypothetical protein
VNEKIDYALMLAVWIVPFATIPMGLAGLPGSFAPILALTGRLFSRIRAAERCRTGAAPTARPVLAAAG